MSIFDDPGYLFDLFLAPPPPPIVSAPWESLPDEIWLNIFSQLPPHELFKKHSVCKKWQQLIDDETSFPIHHLFKKLIMLTPKEKEPNQLFYSPRRFHIQHVAGSGYYYNFDYDTVYFGNLPPSTKKTYTTPEDKWNDGILTISEIFTITIPSRFSYLMSGKTKVEVTGYRVYILDPSYKSEGQLLQRFFDEYFAEKG